MALKVEPEVKAAQDQITQEETNATLEAKNTPCAYSHAFLSLTVDHISFHRPVIEVTEKVSMKEVILLMAEEEISSVPVYSTAENKYLGFVEIKDIVQQLGNLLHYIPSIKHLASE